MNLAIQHSNTPRSKDELRRINHLREHIAEACRLVETRRVLRGVHIVAKGRLTYDELRRYQAYAELHHVKLSVDSHGMISVTPQAPEEK
jgi:hypothetical protein